MIVHLIASREDIIEKIDGLRKLVGAIHKEGHTLALDWIEPAYNRAKRGENFLQSGMANWSDIYKENVEAITKADAIIAEASIPSFGIGYQVAVATRLKKPTLLLRYEGMGESVFAAGIGEECLTYKKYQEDNLDGFVRKFLIDNDIQAKDMRFNFFIDRPIYNYLRWASLKTGKTKAEILRELVQREIKDKEL